MREKLITKTTQEEEVSWPAGSLDFSPLDFLLCYSTKPLVYNRVKPEIWQ